MIRFSREGEWLFAIGEMVPGQSLGHAWKGTQAEIGKRGPSVMDGRGQSPRCPPPRKGGESRLGRMTLVNDPRTASHVAQGKTINSEWHG